VKLTLTYFLLSGLLLLTVCISSLAQTTTQPTLPLCGITELTPQQAQALTKEANQALEKKRASGAVFNTITYIPIRPHIVRRSDGTGGFSMASLNQVMALTNSYYLQNGYGIQFYFAGDTPDNINDDYLYNNGIIYGDGNATNALNQYYVPFISSGAGGYAYYPSNDLISTRSVIAVGGFETEDDLGNRLIPHELGHNFNLIHTFGQNPGNGTLGSGVTTELVTRGVGANCTTDGDLVCDTPADPYNISGANLLYVNGCPQYDPSSTARDANGDAYSPSITNIMSYYFPCIHNFTAGQYDRMQAGLALRQTHTAYTLKAPPTVVTAPSNLTGSIGVNSVVLTWQDNASNEMGYFIERSTAATTGFVPIGGVGPNGTTFTDTKVSFQSQIIYYYRIRPSNTTTGSLSPTLSLSVTPPVVTGLTTTSITANSAQLNWNSLGTNVAYDLQWRAVGSASWYTYTYLYSTNFSLYGLDTKTAYEWRVKVSAGTTYSQPASFTTTCPTPTNLSSYTYQSIAYLYWNSYNGQTYTMQWRPQGNTDWTSVAGIVSGYYSLTGLTPATVYEWQVQGTCTTSPQYTTAFSSPQSFTTLSCQLPNTIYTPDVFSTSARLYWYDTYQESTKTYDIRYRAVGTSDWTTISILSGSSYLINGLTYNTSYEWQIRSNCSPTQSSTFSSSYSFTTTCRVPSYLSSYVTATNAQLYWSSYYALEAGSTYDLQYRPSGATNWITISSLTTTAYSLTGLTTNVTYEWRVRTRCSDTAQSDYSAIFTFTPVCTVPSSLYINQLSSSSAQLVWYGTFDSGTRFDVRYRPVGSPTWATLTSITITSASSGSCVIAGLTNATQYECQVRSVCSDTESSAFTASQNFTTQCREPSMWITVQFTSASVYWSATGPDVVYEVRYRKVGVSDWTILSNLSSTSVSLTGLPTNTQFEVQSRTSCTNGVYSSFTSSIYFSTFSCTPPYGLYVSNRTATAVRLNWSLYYANSDTQYEIRYRIAGTGSWALVGNLTTTNGYGYTDLTNLTSDAQYEWQIRTLCSATESSAFSSSSLFTLCPQMYTLYNGNWNDASIWSCGRIPAAGDILQIKHTVYMPSGLIGTALRIGFDAGKTLNYGTNAQLKLDQ